MKSKTTALAILLALGVTLGLAACGGGDDSGSSPPATTTGESAKETTAEQEPAPPAVETIVVRGGEPVGGPSTLEFDAGEQVRFKVRSDTADEVHVHGYDVTKAVPAGGTVTVTFPADIEGIFEVELHHSGEPLAELRVNP